VLEVPLSTPVFTEAAAAAVPVWSGRGRQPTTPRLVAGTRPARPITAVLAGVDGGDWHPLTVADGAQGPRTYQFIARRVWESRDGLPGREGWLVLRRNLDGSEPKAYLSNAPATIPLVQVAEIGAHRWRSRTGPGSYMSTQPLAGRTA